MNQNNLLRFVSVRPPEAVDPTSVGYIRDDNNIHAEVVEEIEKSEKEKHLSRKDARLDAGKSIVNSERYYHRSNDWLKWLQFQESIKQLVETNVGTPNLDQFKQGIETILSEIYGRTIELGDFIEGNDFVTLKRIIWLSYYANVINPNLIPSDREDLIFWIRFIYLLETTRIPDIFNPVSLTLPKARPSVPHILFLNESQEVVEDEPSLVKTQSQSKIKAIQESIDKLTEVRSYLKQLHAQRWRLQVTQSNETNSVPTENQVSGQGQRGSERNTKRTPGSQPKTGNQSANPIIQQVAPWRLTRKDLEQHQDYIEILVQLGLEIEYASIPDLVQKLEHEIAVLKSKLAAMRYRNEILMVGNVAVKVRRPGADNSGG